MLFSQAGTCCMCSAVHARLQSARSFAIFSLRDLSAHPFLLCVSNNAGEDGEGRGDRGRRRRKQRNADGSQSVVNEVCVLCVCSDFMDACV